MRSYKINLKIFKITIYKWLKISIIVFVKEINKKSVKGEQKNEKSYI